MIVKFSITRYGSPEYRTIDISLEDAVAAEFEGTVSSCGGYEDDALSTIQIDYTETASELVRRGQ